MYHNVTKLMGSNVRVSFWSCSIMFHLFAYLQDEWLSCKILARQRVILQDDVSSCKILPESCKILQDNHSSTAEDTVFMFVLMF